MRSAAPICLVVAFALPAAAQDAPRASEILDAARAECIADVKAADPNAPTPELLVENEALSFWDLDEDGADLSGCVLDRIALQPDPQVFYLPSCI